MKTAIILAVLAVLAVGDAAVLTGPDTRANLQVGVVRPGDRLLNRTYLQKYPIANAVQYQDFIFRGPTPATRISAVFATEVGGTQFAAARILQGGVGYNNVTLRIQSARGRGYYYMIELWGR